MKQTDRTIVVLDVGSSSIKGLLGSLSEQPVTTKEKSFFELQGALQSTRGLSKKGVVHDKSLLSHCIASVCTSLSNSSGVSVDRVHVLFTHPRTQFFTKITGTNSIQHPNGILITEDWLSVKRERILSHIAARHPQSTCTHFSFTSLVVDGEEILYDPYEYTASRSLFLTYQYAITPTAFLESLRESVERVVTVSSLRPAGTAYDCFLSEQQKDRGVLICSVGAQFTTLSVYNDHALSSMRVVPFGGALFTDELALSQRISLEDAEHLKYDLGGSETPLTKKELQSVVKKMGMRLKKELLPHIQDIQGDEALPGGILLFGGGVQCTGISPLFEQFTGFRSPHAPVLQKVQSRQSVDQSLWQPAYGLLHLLANDYDVSGDPFSSPSFFRGFLKRISQSITRLFS